MLPGISGNSGYGGASAQQQPAQAHGSSTSEEETGRFEEGDRSCCGNRWPRQETLALIKVRSDMDVAFRDSSLKGPLWDEVSRKLGELGYHRSAKKCKEKFENVYKYHKRTKEGRTAKADGKTYRFFDQLEALEANPRPPPAMPSNSNNQLPFSRVPSISVAAPIPFSHQNMSNSISSSTSSEPQEVRGRRKRKWKDFFGKLMKEVIDKQEELQMKFLDRIEKREREQMEREEAWRMEEMAKMNREHHLLAQERSIAAAKDASVITFLQKITQQNPNILQPMQQQTPQPPPAPAHAQLALQAVKNLDNGGEETSNTRLAPGPSRWPKAEVNVLINLRKTLDIKYHDNGPKGPLWEEISAAMMKLGYNRSAKRCKEKWENINKYYKKVKESTKKRPDDSKTCPYFHQLDAIYRDKANNKPIIAEPEQQWPLPSMVVQQRSTTHESENIDQNNEDDYEDDDEGEEDEAGDYEIVPNNNSSMAAVE